MEKISSLINILGQALCTECKENTHQAKMFSTHEILHISKCIKETRKWCLIHEEQYIMFSHLDKMMLCATCFQNVPNDAKLHCTEIDTSWQSIKKKMDNAVNSICELQKNMSKGIIDLKLKQDELKKNFDTERSVITVYVQVST